MRINNLQTHIANELRKTDSAARKVEAPKAKPVVKADVVGLSDGARKLSSATQADAAVVTASVASSPDVRMDRVEEVKQRIASGYYNSAEFTDKLAEKLARDFGAKGGI